MSEGSYTPQPKPDTMLTHKQVDANAARSAIKRIAKLHTREIIDVPKGCAVKDCTSHDYHYAIALATVCCVP
jgi:hypothetical protein